MEVKDVKVSFRNFEKNFCSVKWAQRLKEIGVRQDTAFHYVWFKESQEFRILRVENFLYTECCSAFTVQDFVDLFPKLFKFARSGNEWKFYCEGADMHLKDEDRLADVFARILVSITKNKKDKFKKLSHD